MHTLIDIPSNSNLRPMADISLPSWLDQRSSGVLAHVTSLHGPYGIGNLGSCARRFIDLLAEAGCAHWQLCPVGPTGYGDSPYQSFSTFAGNPYLIDLDALLADGLLRPDELAPLRALPQQEVDYGGMYQSFWPILQRAADRFLERVESGEPLPDWQEFLNDNHTWLDPYATFMALKQLHGGRAWTQWEPRWRDFAAVMAAPLPDSIVRERDRQRCYQFWFSCHWSAIKSYANERGIQIIGDVPIFVAHDSADVWQDPRVFRIHPDGSLKVAAGVPPDYFSELGQFWGNPLYDWDFLRQTNYSWWVERMRGSLRLFDLVRLDHFRAFANFWEIPGDAPDARSGRWVDGPGMDLMITLHRALPELRIIAEDLGYIDKAVYDLRMQTGLPGMKVIQFGFGHDANGVNLPHFFPTNSVVYTGTHDNDTTRGWLSKLSGDHAADIRAYYRLADGDNSAWPLMQAALASVSRLAVLPLQDILDLGSAARMNTPGTSSDNWKWRMTETQFADLQSRHIPALKRLLKLTNRIDNHNQHDFSSLPQES